MDGIIGEFLEDVIEGDDDALEDLVEDVVEHVLGVEIDD